MWLKTKCVMNMCEVLISVLRMTQKRKRKTVNVFHDGLVQTWFFMGAIRVPYLNILICSHSSFAQIII